MGRLPGGGGQQRGQSKWEIQRQREVGHVKGTAARPEETAGARGWHRKQRGGGPEDVAWEAREKKTLPPPTLRMAVATLPGKATLNANFSL